MVRSCNEVHRTQAAVEFASKLVSISRASGSSAGELQDDVFLLCDALLRAGEHQRTIFMIEQHGYAGQKGVLGLRFRRLAAEALSREKRWAECREVVATAMVDPASAVVRRPNAIKLLELHKKASRGPMELTALVEEAWVCPIAQHIAEELLSQLDTEAMDYSGRVVGVPSVRELVSALCRLRGQACLLTEDTEAAAYWLEAALVIDPLCSEALTLLVEGRVARPADEDRLRVALGRVPVWPDTGDTPLVGKTDSSQVSVTSDASEAAAKRMKRSSGFGDELSSSLREMDAPSRLELQWGWYSVASTCRLGRYSMDESVSQRFEAVEAVCNGALSDDPDVLATKADAALWQHDTHGAIGLSKRVLSADPFHFQALSVYAWALMREGLNSELQRLAHATQEGLPGSAISHFVQGCLHLSGGSTGEARDALEKAVAIAPSFGPAWVCLGLACSAEEEASQAMSAFRAAARYCPGWHVPLLCLGVEAARAHSTALAEAHLNAARVLCPAEPLTYATLGRILMETDDDAAKDALLFAVSLLTSSKTVRLGPWAFVFAAAGQVLYRCNQFSEAEGMFIKAASLIRSTRIEGGERWSAGSDAAALRPALQSWFTDPDQTAAHAGAADDEVSPDMVPSVGPLSLMLLGVGAGAPSGMSGAAAEAAVVASLALSKLAQEHPWDAVRLFHQSLALDPSCLLARCHMHRAVEGCKEDMLRDETDDVSTHGLPPAHTRLPFSDSMFGAGVGGGLDPTEAPSSFMQPPIVPFAASSDHDMYGVEESSVSHPLSSRAGSGVPHGLPPRSGRGRARLSSSSAGSGAVGAVARLSFGGLSSSSGLESTPGGSFALRLSALEAASRDETADRSRVRGTGWHASGDSFRRKRNLSISDDDEEEEQAALPEAHDEEQDDEEQDDEERDDSAMILDDSEDSPPPASSSGPVTRSRSRRT
jgi:tetratricopeptide (TPR) repeat protein